MYGLIPLLALLPAAFGAPAPQEAVAAMTTIDSAAYSSISSSMSSSISTSLSKAMSCKVKTTTTPSTSSTRASSSSTSRSVSSSSKSQASPSPSTRSSALPSSSAHSSSSSSSSPPKATTWWKPTKANTFLYEADNVAIQAPTVTTNTGLKLNKDVYIVDLEGHTKAQIKAYKDKGKKVVCYLSAGSWEPFRDDKLKFDPACYCGEGEAYNKADGKCKTYKNRMDGWDEWWLDIVSPKCLANIKPIMAARIKSAMDKGCDGVDPDNMDSYTNGVSYGAQDYHQVDYLKWFANEAHGRGLAVGLKNAGGLLANWETATTTTPTKFQKDLVNAFDFSVIESCVQYKECHTYNSMLDAGKPQIRVEYESRTKTCPKKENGVTFSVYSGKVLNTKHINLDC